jgi:branched-subunit amino acid aminotransferase/4-amino-4-deoxychorismate lyase
MAQPPSGRRDELWTSTVIQGWGTPQPQDRRRDPADVLKEEGIEVPADCPPHVMHELARMVSLLWLNGQLISREQFYIDPSDQGLLFGRGLWECTRTFGGVPWLWPLHLERLRHTAGVLDIDLVPERLPDSNQVTAFVRALTGMDVVVRLNVTAGRPGKAGVVWMTAVLPPSPMAAIRLQTCRGAVPTGHPDITWKTFQYGARLNAGKRARQAGFDNALLLDAEGNLLEAANANIFVRLPDGWATPAAGDDRLLPGTVRRHLLENASLSIREQTIPYTLLSEVREAFLTNSNVGIVPVVQIDEMTFPAGTETRVLVRSMVPVSAP